MNGNFFHQNGYAKDKKTFFAFLWLTSLVFLMLSLCSCKKQVDYFSYVTELRNNIFLAENETFSLRVYAIEKESPYVADGIPCEKNVRTEVYLIAPSIDDCVYVYFQVGETEYGGETSYDNVKGEYFYACPLSVATLSCINFRVCYGDKETHLTANSVCPPETLSAKEVLYSVVQADETLFSSLTDKYGFAGEIYMRLIYEDAPFYYVGVINRKCETTAFLVNAVTGRVLAKRTP